MTVVNTNVKSLIANSAIKTNDAKLSKAMEQLSTGKRINSAADDAAGLSISSRMTSQIRGLNQAVRNANDAISLLQIAEGAQVEVTEMLQRMRELAIQSSSDTNTASERSYANDEYQQLYAEIDRIAKNTQFNNSALLTGLAGTNGTLDFQVGANSAQKISVVLDNMQLSTPARTANASVAATLAPASFAAPAAAAVPTAVAAEANAGGAVAALGATTTSTTLVKTTAVTGVGTQEVQTLSFTSTGAAPTNELVAGNTFNLTFKGQESDTSNVTLSYVVQAGDTLADLVVGLTTGSNAANYATVSANTVLEVDGTSGLKLTRQANEAVTNLATLSISHPSTITATATRSTAVNSLANDGSNVAKEIQTISLAGLPSSSLGAVTLTLEMYDGNHSTTPAVGTTTISVASGQASKTALASALDAALASAADGVIDTADVTITYDSASDSLVITGNYVGDVANLSSLVYASNQLLSTTPSSGGATITVPTAAATPAFYQKGAEHTLTFGNDNSAAVGSVSVVMADHEDYQTFALKVTQAIANKYGASGTEPDSDLAAVTFVATDATTMTLAKLSADKAALSSSYATNVTAAEGTAGIDGTNQVDLFALTSPTITAGQTVSMTVGVAGAASGVTVETAALAGGETLAQIAAALQTAATANSVAVTFSEVGGQLKVTQNNTGAVTAGDFSGTLTVKSAANAGSAEINTVPVVASDLTLAEGEKLDLTFAYFDSVGNAETTTSVSVTVAAGEDFATVMGRLATAANTAAGADATVDWDSTTSGALTFTNANSGVVTQGNFSLTTTQPYVETYSVTPVAAELVEGATFSLAIVDGATTTTLSAPALGASPSGASYLADIVAGIQADAGYAGSGWTVALNAGQTGLEISKNFGATAAAASGVTMSLTSTPATSTSILSDIVGSDISTKAGADAAITNLDLAITAISTSRSKMGSVMNRLDHAVNNLINVSTNTSASRSRIEDTDYAAASSDLAKAQIIQQAATAMLAQANQSAQSVLSLLQ